MNLWLSHPALWENTRDDCFQLMRAVGNPYEATLYLRTRAERISFMFLFLLTLILRKATSLRAPELQHWGRPCVSVRVRWSGTESYITSVRSRCATNARPRTRTLIRMSTRNLVCVALSLRHRTQTKILTFSISLGNHTPTHTKTFHTRSSIWVNCGNERRSGWSHPSPPVEKNV